MGFVILLAVVVALYAYYRAVVAFRNIRLDEHDLNKKTVVISGCDRGFGARLVLRLLKKGVPVIAGCYTEKGEEYLKKSAGSGASLLKTAHLDVSKDESVEKFANFVGETVGNKGIWGIVANAGILGKTGPDDWLHVNDYIETINVNTFGVMRFVHGLAKYVKVQRGRVVLMSSISGRTPRPTVGPYCVSKHALEAYGDVIRHELFDFGVNVCILEPGFFNTDLTAGAGEQLDAVWNSISAETKKEYGEEYLAKSDLDKQARNLKSQCSDNLDLVTERQELALFAKYPKRRYYIGADTVYYIGLAVLPTILQDYVIRAERRNRAIPAAAKLH